MKLYADNPIITDNPNTALSAAALAGVTSLPIYTNAGFSTTTNLALVSNYGDEQAEIVKTATTGSSSMALSTGTIYPHPQDTTVTWMPYDQIEFSRTDDGTNWNVLATVPLQVDRNTTVYVDNSGSTGSLWRFRFFNSLSGIYSSYSSSLGQSGYQPYQLEYLQDAVVDDFQDPNLQILTYTGISRWLNQCADILATEIRMSDRMGLTGFVNTILTAGVTNITLPDDYVLLKRFELSYDGGTTYQKASPLGDIDSSMMDGNQTAAQGQFSQNNPVYYKQDNALYFLPNGSVSGGVSPTNYRLWYYRLPTYLVNPSDKLDLIFRPYTYLFNDFCLYKAKLKDKKPNEAAVYLNSFKSNMQGFVASLSRWQLDQPDFIDDSDFDGIMGSGRVPGRL